MRVSIPLLGMVGALALGVVAVLTLSHPPTISIQRGYRGTGMQLEYTPHQIATAFKTNQAPTAIPQTNAGPAAGTIYQNVQVLKNVPVSAFAGIMVSMTQWVAPKQGCGYCHVAGNFASDAKYTKRVARRMIQMTLYINSHWKQHVKNVGVTCDTCHRGNNAPSQVWFTGVPSIAAGGLTQGFTGEAMPSAAADGSALTSDPFTPFLLGHDKIRVSGKTALPNGNRMSVQQTEWTYALMMSYSSALGVNCDYCHNTRAFNKWSESTPQRVIAYYGLHMVRALNNDYMVPLTGTFAHNMLGPSGDVAKINCATCHQGAYKPLLGAKMAAQYPYLEGPGTLADPNPKSPAASGEANPAMITMTAATTTPAASSPSSTTASPSTNTAPASSATTKPTQ